MRWLYHAAAESVEWEEGGPLGGENVAPVTPDPHVSETAALRDIPEGRGAPPGLA